MTRKGTRRIELGNSEASRSRGSGWPHCGHFHSQRWRGSISLSPSAWAAKRYDSNGNGHTANTRVEHESCGGLLGKKHNGQRRAAACRRSRHMGAGMSSTGMLWARKQKTGTPTSKALLMLIGELVNDEGETARGQKFLADIMELSRDAVTKNLAYLESNGFIARRRQQITGKRRSPDRIYLLMQEQFTVDNPPLEDAGISDLCSGEQRSPEQRSAEQRCSEPPIYAVENGTDPPIYAVQDCNKRKQQTYKQEKQKTEAAPPAEGIAVADAPARDELPIEDLPPANVVAIRQPSKEISQRDRAINTTAADIYEGIKHGVPFHGVRKIISWAAGQGYNPNQVRTAFRDLWDSGRAINQQTVAQRLQGIITPDGRPRQQPTTDTRVRAGMDLAEHYRQLEQEAGQS